MSRDPFDFDAARKAMKLSEGPAQELIRQIENDPTIKTLKEIENSSASGVARMLEQTDIQRLFRSATEAQNAFDAYTKSPQWAEASVAIAQMQSDLSRPETLAALQHIVDNLRNIVTASNHAIVPLNEQLQSFSVAAAKAVRPLQTRFENLETWQKSLLNRMTDLQRPWAMEERLGVSIVGFARIARLHDIATGPAPFDPACGEIFEEELGEPVEFDQSKTVEARETVRIDSGLNPEIVAFPVQSYPSVLFSAGFELRIEAVTPVRSENKDETGTLDPQHANLLTQIENRLRALIDAELSRLEGDRWLRTRIHGDVRKKWQERKAKDHDQRGDSYPLLYYADFMELTDIICEGKNWNDAFHQFFGSRSDFQMSMLRLAPVRNAIGHNRPLARADQITLLSEGFRILNALGIRM